MRMSRVNITVPDHVAIEARAAGLNVSRIATAALIEELDRRAKTRALDVYLSQLDTELGPISADEQTSAAAWADRVLSPASRRPSMKRRRSA
jgi:post-segregation antitoxin (ccd killing protein)